MDIKLLKDTYASGRQLDAGKTYKVSDADAKTLVQMGKALSVEEKSLKKPTKAEPKPKPKQQPKQ